MPHLQYLIMYSMLRDQKLVTIEVDAIKFFQIMNSLVDGLLVGNYQEE